MERKIKTLYIVTIIAILAFLGMQSYWLYGRYEYTLSEYESDVYNKVVKTIEEINKNREREPDPKGKTLTHQSTYNINSFEEEGKKKIIATLTSSKYFPLEVLGISDNRKPTQEETRLAAFAVAADSTLAKREKHSFDATNAPSETYIWGAFKHFDTEFVWPLEEVYVDSILQTKNINAEVRLIVTDSIVWRPSVKHHASVFNQDVVIEVPYSEFDRKSISITCAPPVSTIFDNMIDSLVIAVVLSIFLIVCLIWQIRTIRHMLRLDDVRNRFVHTMIHELKRPISTLKICLSSLANPRICADEKSRGEIVDDCRMAVNNLSTYFSRLRDIMFNDASQIPLDLESCRMHDVVDSVIAKTIIPSGKKVNINNGVAQDISIVADRLHLLHILSNLVENAIKYSGDNVCISIECESYCGGVAIRVSDNGNGISDNDLNKIFNKFYRSASAIKSGAPGVGLGLAYVKLLAEAHGGEVSVESQEGEGSVFTIKLPQ